MATINLATLLRIYPYNSAVTLRYQNYRRSAPILFRGDSYDYAGFSVITTPEADLQLTSQDMQIVIRDSSVLRSLMQANNDLKRAEIEAIFIQIGKSVPPEIKTSTISYATREGGNVLFTAKATTNAIQGNNITKHVAVSEFPELPQYQVRL
jgi:hypothetical protein